MRKILLIFTFWLVLFLAGSCGPGSMGEESPTPRLSATDIPPTPILATPVPTIAPTIIPPDPVDYPEPDPAWEGEADFTVCQSGCSHSSIQAVLDHIPGDDLVIIELPDGIHSEAGIEITHNVLIRGQGQDLTILQASESVANAPDRVFLVKKGGSLVLSSLTIQHGKPAKFGDKGGGIRNFGDLFILNSQVRNNQANGGGGISNSGNLTILNSTISDNLADGEAEPGLACGNGAGIQSGSGELLIFNSTISGNLSTVTGRARGAGIHVGCSCQALIVNSTISNNRAARVNGETYRGGHSHGGGIYVAGSLKLVHTTITGNHANGDGGGVYVAKHLDYINSLIVGNTGKRGNCVMGGTRQDGSLPTIGTNLFNFVGGGGCEAAFSGEAELGSLEDHGGWTEIHALLPESQPLNLIPEPYCITTMDQLGNPRPSLGETPPMCDPGAFELQP